MGSTGGALGWQQPRLAHLEWELEAMEAQSPTCKPQPVPVCRSSQTSKRQA